VAALKFIQDHPGARVAIIDLDVHQGNGTASILAGRSDIYVLSFHGARNFPFIKVPSTVDVALPDDTGDIEYLMRLEDALPAVFAFGPSLVLYQAGVDPLKADRLGKLGLTHLGLEARDQMVLEHCSRRGIPVALALGGGYASPIERTVEAHVTTYRVVKECLKKMKPPLLDSVTRGVSEWRTTPNNLS
jgi:acetoin utilization deacetylase AcuC-like enzyme